MKIVTFGLICVGLNIGLHGTLAQLPDPPPILPPIIDKVEQTIPASPTPTPVETPPIPPPTPTPPPAIKPVTDLIDIGPTPTQIETPTPTPPRQGIIETNSDTRTVANGYITTFHAGTPSVLPSPVAGTYSTLVVIKPVTVTTVEGDVVPLSPNILFTDKNGNPIDPTTVPRGTRMQATEIVDDPNVGRVVQEIMVDL